MQVCLVTLQHCPETYDSAILQLDDKSNNAAYTLRQVYQKHLLAYEEYDREREPSAEASQCPPANSGSKRSSEPRDDAEEAADILNAIMGLSSLAQPEHAPPVKRAKSVGMVRAAALMLVWALHLRDSFMTDSQLHTLAIVIGVRDGQSGLGPDPGARQHLHTQL